MPTIAHPINNTHTKSYKVIEVSDVQAGSGSTIATFSLKIGGLFFRQVTLRRGRNGTTYLNFPSRKDEHGRWIHLVEILTPSLETFIQDVCYKAVGEALRYE